MAGSKIEFNSALFTILWMISILILTGNVLTITLILRSEKLRNATGGLMASLATADIGVGLTTLIPLIHYIVTPTMTDYTVNIIGYFNSVTWVISVYTLMLLSIDRYLAVSKPMKYDHMVTYRSVMAAVTLIWTLSFLLWLFPLVGVGGFKFNDEEVACYFDVAQYPAQWILYMVLIFVPSTSVIAFCYLKIWKISRTQIHQIESQHVGSDNASKWNWKAVRTLLVISCAFILAWLPFVIEHIVKASLGKLENIPEWLEIAIYVIAISNSFWNPIIYISTNVLFREEFKRLICRRRV